MVRQLEWDEGAGSLISRPVPEYSLLHNATLLAEPSMSLSPGVWSPALRVKGDSAAGAAAEISLRVLIPNDQPVSIGVAVLVPSGASVTEIADSATVWLNVSAPSSSGGSRHGTLSLSNKNGPPTGGNTAFASQGFTVGASDHEVDMQVFVDRYVSAQNYRLACAVLLAAHN
eukprot:COSAG02_NODE_10929_length_1830_cov_2.502600_1_plen_172_part_00